MEEQRYPMDFQDPRTGARARVTQHALVIFTSPCAPGEYQGVSTEYPLHKIGWVRAIPLPGGQTAIALGVDGEPKSPGLTFEDARIAHEFQQTLLKAIQRTA